MMLEPAWEPNIERVLALTLRSGDIYLHYTPDLGYGDPRSIFLEVVSVRSPGCGYVNVCGRDANGSLVHHNYLPDQYVGWVDNRCEIPL